MSMTAPNIAAEPIKPTKPPRSLKQRALIGMCGFVLLLIFLFFSYQWAGTSVYRGTVQRVYEQGTDYRAEIVDLEGNVHVVGNEEIKFPYFKLDTADVHAQLNRFSQTRDLVEVTVWGFRMSWFSTFPNLVEARFVMSKSDRDRKRADRVADAVLKALENRDGANDTEALRPVIQKAVQESLGSE